jgi:hypothetical protein
MSQVSRLLADRKETAMLRFKGLIDGNKYTCLPVVVELPWHGDLVEDAVAVIDVRNHHTTSLVHVMVKTHGGTTLLTIRQHKGRTEIVPFDSYNGDWEAARAAGISIPPFSFDDADGDPKLVVPTGLFVNPNTGTLVVRISADSQAILLRIPWTLGDGEGTTMPVQYRLQGDDGIDITFGKTTQYLYDEVFKIMQISTATNLRVAATWTPRMSLNEICSADAHQRRLLMHRSAVIDALLADVRSMTSQVAGGVSADILSATSLEVVPSVNYKLVCDAFGITNSKSVGTDVMRSLFPDMVAGLNKVNSRLDLLKSLVDAKDIGGPLWEAAQLLLRFYDDSWFIVVLGRDCHVLYRMLRILGRNSGVVYSEISRPVIYTQADEVAEWIEQAAAGRKVLIIDSGFSGTIPAYLEQAGLQLRARLLCSENPAIQKIGRMTKNQVLCLESLPKYAARAKRLSSLEHVAARETSNSDMGEVMPAVARLVEYFILNRTRPAGGGGQQ